MALHYSSAPVRLGSAAVPAAGLHPRCTASLRSYAAGSAPKARFVAKRTESATVQQLQRPLSEYMSLPASQYSVLDAERIERIDDNTFRCYVYRFKFFSFEVCPVLVVCVDVEPNGCCIRLLSCKIWYCSWRALRWWKLRTISSQETFDIDLVWECSFHGEWNILR